MEWTPPPDGIAMCQGGVKLYSLEEETSMNQPRSVRCRTIFVWSNDPGPWEFRLDDGRAGYWNGKSPSGTPGGRESVPGRLHDGTGPPSSDRHPRHAVA